MTPNYGRGRSQCAAACFLDQFTLLIDCLVGWRNQSSALFLLRLVYSVSLHACQNIRNRSFMFDTESLWFHTIQIFNDILRVNPRIFRHVTVPPAQHLSRALTKPFVRPLQWRCRRKQFVQSAWGRNEHSSDSPGVSRTKQGLCKIPPRILNHVCSRHSITELSDTKFKTELLLAKKYRVIHVFMYSLSLILGYE